MTKNSKDWLKGLVDAINNNPNTSNYLDQQDIQAITHYIEVEVLKGQIEIVQGLVGRAWANFENLHRATVSHEVLSDLMDTLQKQLDELEAKE